MNNNNDEDDFQNYTLNELKRFISVYKKHHNIINSSKMKKNELIEALRIKFLVHK